MVLAIAVHVTFGLAATIESYVILVASDRPSKSHGKCHGGRERERETCSCRYGNTGASLDLLPVYAVEAAQAEAYTATKNYESFF
jgi:hypothetical protein